MVSKYVKIKINSQNYKKYNLSIGDEVNIPIEELSIGSHRLVDTKCDICNKEKIMEYRTYYELTKGLKEKYYCQKCSREKYEKTNLERYGSIYPMQNKDIFNKLIQTNLEKYGVEHSSQLDEYKEKQKVTNLEKYGLMTPLQDIDKRKKGMVEKHGVDSPMKNEILRNKIKNTNIERYSFDNPWKNKEIRKKIKNTNIDKYGFENPTSNENIRNKINETKKEVFLKKYKNYNIINYDISNRILTMFCDKGHQFNIDYTTFINRVKLNTKLCIECYPIGTYSNSGYEIQLQDFIKENYNNEIKLNKRIISPNEIDIYLPDLKLAFEFNGIYWHNELNVSNHYHLNKTEECEKRDIQLIHIYEDDWKFKQEIVKSRILNLLKKTPNKIHGRKCKVKEITDNKIVREFLNDNHIQGFVGSQIKIGLFYNEELVSLMTFGKQRKSMGTKSKNGVYEMLRFCNKLNTSVIGGADKLFKYFTNIYHPVEVISYADRSWSQGELYKKLKFTYVGKTLPNYYYVIDYLRQHRFNFRKDKLIREGYDSTKSEHDIMLERKIYRIYDSGSLKFSFK